MATRKKRRKLQREKARLAEQFKRAEQEQGGRPTTGESSTETPGSVPLVPAVPSDYPLLGSAEKLPPRSGYGLPWYESTLLWGAFGAAIAIVLVVVAAMMKDLRWLFIVAWPFAGLAVWAATKGIRSPRIKWLVAIAGSIVIAAGLYSLNVLLALNMVPAPGSIRVKYSSTQVIQVSNEPGNYNTVLHLAEVATMFSYGGDRDSIEMILATSPPLTIKNPRPGDHYNLPGGLGVGIPSASTPGISIDLRDAQVATGEESFIFDRLKPPSTQHVVKAASRKFTVTLKEINDKSTKSQTLREYTFGISEE